jgi:DNA-binding XRE family transcriptional regulator
MKMRGVFRESLVTSELEDQHQIGQLLRVARKERGYTQKQVARLAGISPLSYKFIENGRTGTRITTLMSIGRALGFEIMLVPKAWVPAVNALLNPLDVIDPSSSEAFTFDLSVDFNTDRNL